MGTNALLLLGTGSSNIALGYYAGYNLTSGDYNVYLANQGVSTESNTIRIGDPTNQTSTYVSGIYGATAASGVAVYVNSSGQLGTLTSSRRFKKDIADMDASSEAILSLRPVAFRYKEEIDKSATPQFGLIAEEVEKVDPKLVARDGKGAIYTVRYEAVNAMMLNEFLKEHKRVEAQSTKVNAQQDTISKQQETISAQQKKIEKLDQRMAELSRLIQKVADKIE